jgi:hypothetical protein
MKSKYNKYKLKYLNLKHQGGSNVEINEDDKINIGLVNTYYNENKLEELFNLLNNRFNYQMFKNIQYSVCVMNIIKNIKSKQNTLIDDIILILIDNLHPLPILDKSLQDKNYYILHLLLSRNLLLSHKRDIFIPTFRYLIRNIIENIHIDNKMISLIIDLLINNYTESHVIIFKNAVEFLQFDIIDKVISKYADIKILLDNVELTTILKDLDNACNYYTEEYYDDELNTIVIKKDIIIYHGTTNKLNDNIVNSPSFYSTDILQSLGHILINKSLTTYYYHMIYEFIIKSDIVVLNIEYPYDNKFNKLFNPKILLKYIKLKPNKINIIVGFINRLMKYTQKYQNIVMMRMLNKIVDHLILIYNGCNDKYLPYISDKMLDIYLNSIILDLLINYCKLCKESCFATFNNIIGYYLLSQIDYNAYLRECKIIESDVTIDGIYVKEDQNEIIIFNNTKLEYSNIYYIAPYSMINSSTTEIKEYIKNNINIDPSSSKYRTHINLLLMINKPNLWDFNKSNLWNFNWFGTPCKGFNPYTHEMTDCRVGCDYLYNKSYKEYQDTNVSNCGEDKSFKISYKIKGEKGTPRDKINNVLNFIFFIRSLSESELQIKRELAERELAERELAERELAERELAERELAERKSVSVNLMER